MTETLIEALRSAGAKSTELHKIARTDVPADQAVAELRRTYPGAFAPAVNVRTATPAEYAALKKDAIDVIRRDRNAAFQIQELERLGIRYGVKK